MDLLNVSLETKGMAFLRFKKTCQIVCTESPSLNGDVVGYDGKWIYEIEVKRSFSDFKADFKKIKKHENMASDKGLANYFWFLVDPSIKDKCLKYLEEEVDCKKYGLLIPSDRQFNYVESIKTARRIHDTSPHPTRVRDLQRRMSSELVNIRLVMDGINGHISNLINKVDQITAKEQQDD